MLAKSPLVELQTAIFDLLSNDAGLIGVGVYDEPPEDAAMPYVRIGETLSIPSNEHDTFGREVVCSLHVWTEARSNLPGQTIANRIGELLDHQVAALTMPGHDIGVIRLEFDQALRDPRPGIRHHVLRFRINTQQQED